ncbi:MAG: metallophosphoesterase family protein [Planctomycetaceae bacterium]|nr:metallophosphoesterase family protein [Planctomycetaceae bacterium]
MFAVFSDRIQRAWRSRLETGLERPLHIREEFLSHSPDACRLLYISDVHLRRRRGGLLADQVLATVHMSAPHAVLLGGDLLDDADQLPQLSQLVVRLRDHAPVFAVGGNHDRKVGLAKVQGAVERAGGDWIHDRTVRLEHESRRIAIAGPEATVPGDADIRILCAHHPRIWHSVRHQGFDLVLAGHLHGCQFVAFESRDFLFPGALFYSGCCLRTQCGSARLVVSRGVSDLIPIRWRCPREVVLCHV